MNLHTEGIILLCWIVKSIISKYQSHSLKVEYSGGSCYIAHLNVRDKTSRAGGTRYVRPANVMFM